MIQRSYANDAEVPLGFQETRPLSDDHYSTPGISVGWHDVPEELVDHPRYEILGLLGAGGMGVVYKAQHRLMQRVVALKIVHPSLLRRPEMIERFRREVRTAARLTHPNIVHAYDAEQWRKTHFLVMEFVEGLDLERVLTRDERINVERACDYARQVALGLQHAHERGMIHRDIKPHNLMLAPGEVIKILDFGLARFVEEAAPPPAAQAQSSRRADPSSLFETSADMRMGTADYLAPEAIADPHQADIRADIYSLGCTLYRLVSGQFPCPDEELEAKLGCHERAAVKPLSEVCSGVPVALSQIVDRMLANDPADRFQTPREVAAALATASASQPQVLVVDDEPAMQQITSRVLSAQGYAVSCAANGREALSRLRGGFRPDLILLDLMMPVMDGWEFLRQQKQDESLASIPVVVISSNDAVALRAAAAGAINCLKKPLHFRELTETLDAIQA